MKCINILQITFVLLVLILSVSTAAAQEQESDHSLQPGARALQFQISDDVNLESFSGTVISYKLQKTNHKANRMGVSFNGSYSNQGRQSEDSDLTETDLDINLSVNFSWMNYINPQNDIKFYYGYGPEVSAGYDRREGENENTSDDVIKLTLLGAGALGYAGIEWFFQQSMSIHAEYQASARLTYINQKAESQNLKNTSKQFRLGGNGVQFGISVYF